MLLVESLWVERPPPNLDNAYCSSEHRSLLAPGALADTDTVRSWYLGGRAMNAILKSWHDNIRI
jgi:hypothetical protein